MTTITNAKCILWRQLTKKTASSPMWSDNVGRGLIDSNEKIHSNHHRAVISHFTPGKEVAFFTSPWSQRNSCECSWLRHTASSPVWPDIGGSDQLIRMNNSFEPSHGVFIITPAPNLFSCQLNSSVTGKSQRWRAWRTSRGKG